jgi:hypothetical protein
MWLLTKRTGKQCEGVRDALERGTERREARGSVALGTLLARLPERGRKHVSECGDCRTFAEELLGVRGMFESEENGAKPGPFFLSRVMAAIADREMELEKSAQTWAAVPRLAYRLSVLVSLTLLIAGSWLYQRPVHTVSMAGVSAEQSSEGLVEGGGTTIQDDFLLNTTGR